MPGISPPEKITVLESQWLAWLDFLEVRLAQNFESLPFSTVGRERPFPINAADNVRSMFSETMRIAASALAGSDGFEIDADLYFDRFCGPDVSTTVGGDRNHERDIDDMSHIARARTFSPVAVYQAIATDYSPARIKDIVKTTLAQTLYAAFRMGHTPVVMRAGCAVLEMSAYAYKTHDMRGSFTYSCSTEQSLMERLTPLVLLLTEHFDRDGYLPSAESALTSIFRGGGAQYGFVSRQRLSLTPDVALVLYQKKIDVLIDASVAARLNWFLGEWLPHEAQAA